MHSQLCTGAPTRAAPGALPGPERRLCSYRTISPEHRKRCFLLYRSRQRSTIGTTPGELCSAEISGLFIIRRSPRPNGVSPEPSRLAAVSFRPSGRTQTSLVARRMRTSLVDCSSPLPASVTSMADETHEFYENISIWGSPVRPPPGAGLRPTQRPLHLGPSSGGHRSLRFSAHRSG